MTVTGWTAGAAGAVIVAAEEGAVAHGDRPQHLRAGAHHHVVAQGRVALALVQAGAAQGDTLVDKAVIAYHGGLSDNDPHAMIDDETPPQGCPRMNLDTGEHPTQMRHESSQGQSLTLPEFI